jgi:5-methylcytosine-specific restriction endonuclease McrA
MADGLTKPKRYESKRNLSLIRNLPCVVCSSKPCDPDHIKTKGSGGGDNLSNLNPLCRTCHIARHTLGIKTFLHLHFNTIVENRKALNLPSMNLRSESN